MRTATVTYYKFAELSVQAQQKAIMEERESLANSGLDYIFDEAVATLERFCKIFDINYRTINFLESYRNNYTINLDENILGLQGLRLRTYLLNNYGSTLYKRKYIKYFDSHKEHTMIVNKTAKRTGKKYCLAYSNIQLDNVCVLTGVCYDDDILAPIYNFINKPYKITFEELIEECINSLCDSVSSEYEYNLSDEYITEQLAEKEFDINGNEV